MPEPSACKEVCTNSIISLVRKMQFKPLPKGLWSNLLIIVRNLNKLRKLNSVTNVKALKQTIREN